MDWKLVFQLSLFGLAMGIATVFVIPSNIEPWFWLLIFGVCAFLIARVGVQAFISFTVFRSPTSPTTPRTAMMKSMPSQCQIRKINCQDKHGENMWKEEQEEIAS
jgi:hypothetical protein